MEKIAEGPHADVYKAYHKKNPDQMLVLKVLKTVILSADKKSHIKQRIEHLKILSDPMVITPLSLDSKDGLYFITQDYFNGLALDIALGKIVAKLMHKEPEKRYISGAGLLADLIRCRDEYAATGSIKEFPLESRTYAQRTSFISIMVGREKEARIILEEYEEVIEGKFRSLFISGLSGIGKTRLIQELQKPIVED